MESNNSIDSNEFWRQIPPEEKFDLISKSHATGIQASFFGIVIGCTLAVSLHQPWLMWISLIIAPFIFQFAAGKAWRGMRPRLMLEYLAVRSAGRRFAFAFHGKDLSVHLIFRGTLTKETKGEQEELDIRAAQLRKDSADVWIALFTDSVVMMTEKLGGAEVKFGHLLNDGLTIESENPGGDTEYSNDYKVFLISEDKKGTAQRFSLTSRHPAALIVFEKKIQVLIKEAVEKQKNAQVDLDAPGGAAPGGALDFDSMFAAQSQ